MVSDTTASSISQQSVLSGLPVTVVLQSAEAVIILPYPVYLNVVDAKYYSACWHTGLRPVGHLTIGSSTSANIFQVPWFWSRWRPKVRALWWQVECSALCISGLLLLRTLALWRASGNLMIRRFLLASYFVSVSAVSVIRDDWLEFEACCYLNGLLHWDCAVSGRKGMCAYIKSERYRRSHGSATLDNGLVR